VEVPQKRFEHGKRLRCDGPVRPALLGLAAQAAGPMHDPDFGVAVEGAGAAEAENLLAALGGPTEPKDGGFGPAVIPFKALEKGAGGRRGEALPGQEG
jgi:hypothetical protein